MKRNFSISELLRLAFDSFLEQDDRMVAELLREIEQVKATLEKQASALVSMRAGFAELNVGALPTALLGIQERLDRLYREDLNARKDRDVQLSVTNEILQLLSSITESIKETA